MIAGVRGARAFAQFREVGQRVSGPTLSIVKVDGSEHRVAFSVSRRVGNAVTRNKLRRRLRELLRSYAPEVWTPGTYLVIANPRAADQNFGELDRSLRDLLGRLT